MQNTDTVDVTPQDELEAAIRATAAARRKLTHCLAWLRRTRDRVMEIERATHHRASAATDSRAGNRSSIEQPK